MDMKMVNPPSYL